MRPGATSDNIVASYDANTGFVSSVTRDGVTYGYSYVDNGSTRTTTVTDPNGGQKVYTSNIGTFLISQVQDEKQKVTTYTLDGQGRQTQVTYPEGDSVAQTYDPRGNLTETRQKAKPSLPAPDIVTTALYPDASCTGITCNSPTWTRDAKSNQTDYTYDGTTGQVTSVTAPAPSNGAVRPQTRYGYSSVSGVSMLTGISQCQTQASCVGSADEVKTTIGYNSNLLPTSVTKGAGDGSLTASVQYGYDAVGNMSSATGPLGAVTTMTYGADRELTGVVGADPDGAGPRLPQATQYTYDAMGRLLLVATGTVPNQSTTLAGFSEATHLYSEFDANSRLARQSLWTSAGVAYAVGDIVYDNLGRQACSITHMDPARWGSPATSCTPPQTDGPNGPDRVTLSHYDALGRVDKVTSGVGTAAQSDDITKVFTDNGQVRAVIDANGNTTGYVYDGFDRLSATYYPSTTTGAGTWDGNNYEQLTYDDNGNVTAKRLRDGQTIGFGYDALGRRTNDYNPGTNVAEVNASYSYDLLGRVTRAGDDNGWFGAWEYDALGRATRQYSNIYGNRFQYDAGGRMTRQTWDDGFFVTYGYDATGAMTGIWENGTNILVSFTYDDLGRRTNLYRVNNTSTNYGYDGVSRLTSLTLNGSPNANAVTFGYNPAGQITSRTSSNDAYAWTGAVNVARGYVANGLNQYTQSGSVTPTYDGRGNLTGAGGQTYTYNTKNQLYTTGGGGLFYRNPTGVLGLIVWPNEGFILDYVGDRLSTERDFNGNLLRRYIYGPGTDEPLVWYEGAGTTDRRFLHADERGSIVEVTDTNGQTLAINSYDEHGIPGPNNIGRFQYTGQKWLPELGMYDYKARMYSPTLGRFLQTDPIGYGDGLNWYNYVGSDPINATDPSGLKDPDTQIKRNETDTDPGTGVDGTPGDIYVNGDRCRGQCRTILISGGNVIVISPLIGESIAAQQGDIIVVAKKGKPQKGDQTPQPDDAVVTGTIIKAQYTPIPPTFHNDNTPACKVAEAMCRAFAYRNARPGDSLSTLRLCRSAAEDCNDAAHSPPNSPLRPSIYTFPDRSVVVVPRVGPPRYYAPGTFVGY